MEPLVDMATTLLLAYLTFPISILNCIPKNIAIFYSDLDLIVVSSTSWVGVGVGWGHQFGYCFWRTRAEQCLKNLNSVQNL